MELDEELEDREEELEDDPVPVFEDFVDLTGFLVPTRMTLLTGAVLTY